MSKRQINRVYIAYIAYMSISKVCTYRMKTNNALLTSEVATAAATSGYTDIIAVADLSSFRRLPWENNMPFFLLHFHVGGKPVAACPRGIMSSITKKLAANNFKALAGGKTIICHFEDCLARFDD